MSNREYIESLTLRIALAVLSGAGLALSFPNAAIPGLAFIALAPLIIIAATARTRFEASLLGGISLVVTWLINIPWIIPVMNKFGGLPYPTAVALYFTACIILAIYGALFAFIVRTLRLGRSPLPWLLVPLAWAVVEYVRTYTITGVPWNLLANTLIDSGGLVQPAAIVGPYAIGAMIVVTSSVIAWGFVARPSRRQLVLPVSLLGAFLSLWALGGSVMLSSERKTIATEPKQRVAIIQPNITQDMRWDAEKTFLIFGRMISFTKSAAEAKPSVIVWPESTVPLTFLANPFYQQAVESISAEIGADIILGSIAEDAQDSSRMWNSAYLVTAGQTKGRYDKIHLVPFGEYVPLRKMLFFAEKLVKAVGTFQFGENEQPLRGRNSYGPAICYEVVFPRLTAKQITNGADVLVTITNDAWFDVSAAPRQHLNGARLRAVEGRRYLLRAATTGISALVDPTGRVVASLPLNSEGIIAGEFALRKAITPYVRFGDWFAWLSIAVVICAAVIRSRKVTK